MRDLLELLRSDEVQDIGYVFGDSCARSRHHQASRVERQQRLFPSWQLTESVTLAERGASLKSAPSLPLSWCRVRTRANSGVRQPSHRSH